MIKKITVLVGVLTMALAPLGADAQSQSTLQALDAYWAEVSRTVAEGDFEGYAATYHDDAVLVNLSSAASYPIADALAGWKSGFDDTKEGRMKASVSFRFTQRLHDASTAHETGIFEYTATPTDGEPTVYRVHFEALLVNRDGWKMVMEYQKDPASVEEWEAVGR